MVSTDLALLAGWWQYRAMPIYIENPQLDVIKTKERIAQIAKGKSISGWQRPCRKGLFCRAVYLFLCCVCRLSSLSDQSFGGWPVSPPTLSFPLAPYSVDSQIYGIASRTHRPYSARIIDWARICPLNKKNHFARHPTDAKSLPAGRGKKQHFIR